MPFCHRDWGIGVPDMMNASLISSCEVPAMNVPSSVEVNSFVARRFSKHFKNPNPLTLWACRSNG